MEYLFTERAHLMCPRMNFAIVMSVKREYDEERIKDCLKKLSDVHPFLRALLGYEQDRNVYFYNVTDSSKVEFMPSKDRVQGLDSPEITDAFHTLTDRDWDLTAEGMLKVIAWGMGAETCFLMVFHHLLADGRGALGLAQEMAELYVYGKEPVFAPEKLIASVNEFPANSKLPFVSRFFINRANKTAAKEQEHLSYEEYHRFARDFLKTDRVSLSMSDTDTNELKEIHGHCHDNGVTVNDYLLAKMMLEDNTDKIIMACDLRDRLSCYNPGALGNYSTAFGVTIRKKSSDIYALAKQAHAQVQKIMKSPSNLYLVLQCYASLRPEIIDKAMISCRGGFESEAGRFVGGMFFGFKEAKGYSITNLGRIESDCITAACFIPPASPAIKKTQGVLTVNGVMRIATAER